MKTTCLSTGFGLHYCLLLTTNSSGFIHCTKKKVKYMWGEVILVNYLTWIDHYKWSYTEHLRK